MWRHPVLEGLAVLAGILVAFGIDALWEERRDRVQERVYLSALRDEFEDARIGLARRDQQLAEDMKSTVDVLSVLATRASDGISDDSVNVLAVRQGPLTVYTPPRAALNDLTNSGGIGLVQSATLRRALATYEQLLAQDLSEQEAMVQIWLDYLAPYRVEHATMNIRSVADSLNLAVDPMTSRLFLDDVDRASYVRNPAYSNLLVARLLRVRNARGSLAAVLNQIDRILGLLGSGMRH
jgi:hypothetical protein